MRHHCKTVILLLALLSGCAKSEEVLSVDRMVDLLFDIYRFEATTTQSAEYIADTTRVKYYNGIFAKHHITKEQYDRSLDYYASNPERWRLVYQKLRSKSELYLEQIQNGQLEELREHGIAQAMIDTVNYWLSKEEMYWYRDDNAAIDYDRLRQHLEGRKYFTGASKVELTFRMRCLSDSADTVRTSMIVRYPKTRQRDTLSVQAPADNKWRLYRLSTGTPRRDIFSVTVTLADSLDTRNLKAIEYEDVRLGYIYSKGEKHVNENDLHIFNRMRDSKRDRQYDFNSKRDKDGKKNSGEQSHDRFLPALRRHGRG